MNVMTMLGRWLAPVTELIRQRGARRQIETQSQADVARIDAQSSAQQGQAAAAQAQTQTEAERDWDLLTATQAATSWKDEYWTIVFGLPVILAFIPGCAGFVTAGFAALASAPGWYQAGLAAAVAFSFGLRHVVQMMQARWGARG